MSPTQSFRFDRRTQEILEYLTIPFAIYQYVDKRVVTIALSRGFCDEFGFASLSDAYDVMDNDMYRATHPDDKTRVADAAYRFAALDIPYDIVYRTRTLKDADYIILHAYGKSIYPKPGVRLCLTWYANEGHYTPGQETAESVFNQALTRFLTEESRYRGMYFDYMTGLPNMAYFHELAEAGCRRLQEQGIGSAILFFDLTGLKHFNRWHGFGEGNHLICAVANVIAAQFGSENCARFAQDHFAAFAPEEGLQERLEAVIVECAAANDGKTLPLRIGVYPNRIEEVEIGAACDRAKLAANVWRQRKDSYYAFFDMQMLAEEKNRQEIIDNLDRAIEEGWIHVYYQPIVRSTNGKVCDVEALARWHDPVRGMLMPSSFISVLEESMLIHKLDLCVVRQVLRDLKANERAGNRSVPVSINFSRMDFDAYDLVQTICDLVDEAQVDRKMLNIEITESVVGSDFDYIKAQVERFRAQGFQVWMDDFGSGYSSLDVLQSIRFDLIKFDMGFLRRLDEGDAGKIILTEMMKMATSLGVDTVCEGVETGEQVRFLQEIGCAKLQGYYFSRPVPPDQIIQRYIRDTPEGFEEPREAAYYDTVGRVNLFDLSFLANTDDTNVVRNAFDTVPMGIVEVNGAGDMLRFVRSNQSFRDFMRRFFQIDLSDPDEEHEATTSGPGSGFMRAFEQSRSSGGRAFVDDVMSDGSVVHSFLRRMGANPVNGRESAAIAVLSITEPDESTTYAEIAQALAADYYNIFVIDLETNDYIEYSSTVGNEGMSLERHGEDFFASARRDAMVRIYEKDRASFLSLFTKENVIRILDKQGVFSTSYRLVDTGTPVYVNMKVTRMCGGNRLILGVSNIDARMKQLEEERRLRQEKVSLGRVAALSPNYIVLYAVDLTTGHYTQYQPSSAYKSVGLASQGEDFFTDVVLDAPKAIAPEDIERHIRVLTKDNMLRAIREQGFFVHNYRLLMAGEVVPVSLKATLVNESDGEKLILGVTNDEQEEYRRKLAEADKVREINKSITALLDNMPGMTFTKDAKTGVYLACNQAFAEYAHKDTPAGVAGLTDAEIFDAETASHFVEDDAIALAMDKPYLFFEDVPDAAGNQRQFQTTKFKYVDAAGRLCLQGMCQDVTDMVRIKRENATTRAAYEKARTMSVIYNHLAHALARGYSELYYVNIESDEFIEFHTDDKRGLLSEARRGSDFFEGCERDAKLFVHPEDQQAFVRAMNPQFLDRALATSKVFELTYRRMIDGNPKYVQMQASRMEDDGRLVVLAVQDVDELMRQRRAEERIKEERIIYARLHALTGNFICVYVVDPETGAYREFSATVDYEKNFARAKEGTDFFSSVRRDAVVFAYHEDVDRFLAAFTKQNVLAEVERSGFFSFGYRIVMEGKPRYVQMKAAMVEEQEGPRLIAGLNDIDAQVRQEEEYARRLAQAQTQANTDALTGVKNKHAYVEEEALVNRLIAEGQQPPFAVVIFDVNDLKKVNDTAGHQAGDQYLRDTCNVISSIFEHSTVFRVGGDEFAVIARGSDYMHVDELVARVGEHNVEASRSGGVVIACGMSRFQEDCCVSAVFQRADQNMYRNKSDLKAAGRRRS